MKYTDTLKEFLTGYIGLYLRIVTKVGTKCDGYLQSWSETSIVIANHSSIIIDIKDIASIEEDARDLAAYYDHCRSLETVAPTS